MFDRDCKDMPDFYNGTYRGTCEQPGEKCDGCHDNNDSNLATLIEVVMGVV